MFDKSEAIELFCITEQEYDEMLREYVAQTRTEIATIERAIVQKDFKTAAEIVHSVKGISGNLRVQPAFEYSKSIENEIKSEASAFALKHLCILKDFIAGLATDLSI